MGWADPASLHILKSINAITIKLETWMVHNMSKNCFLKDTYHKMMTSHDLGIANSNRLGVLEFSKLLENHQRSNIETLT